MRGDLRLPSAIATNLDLEAAWIELDAGVCVC